MESNYNPKGKGNLVVIDTSSLIHDPSCLSHYKDNIVIITSTVLQELDKVKDKLLGGSEAVNIRKASKALEWFSEQVGNISEGILNTDTGVTVRFVAEDMSELEAPLDPTKGDDRILGTCMKLKQSLKKGKEILLVTNDILLGLRAAMYDIKTSKYQENLLKLTKYTGHREEPIQETPKLLVDSLHKAHVWTGTKVSKKYKLQENEFCIVKGGATGKSEVRCYHRNGKLFRIPREFQIDNIKALNDEQAYAMQLLMDPSVKMVTLTGRAGSGKAQPLDSNVLTPEGYVRMGDIVKGSKVLTPTGKSVKVLQVFPQGEKEVYRVEFVDGRSVECCEDHLWSVIGLDRDDGSKIEVADLKQLIKFKSKSHNKSRGRVPLVNLSLDLIEKEREDLPIDPYVLGALIGDGCFRTRTPTFSTADAEILNKLKRILGKSFEMRKTKHGEYDYSIVDLLVKHTGKGKTKNRLVGKLESLDLYGKYSYEKSIPEVYLKASLSSKLKLLQGLMDTDGYADTLSTVSFSSSSKKLATQVQSIIWELGGIARIAEKLPYYKDKAGRKVEGRLHYIVNIRHRDKRSLFSLKRKKERIKKKDQYTKNLGLGIKDIKKIGKKECQCILIDDKDHLYVTDNYVVTHNTLISIAAALAQVIGNSETKYSKVVLSRSLTVMGGKDKLGFLPGDLSNKLRPFLMPLQDAIDFVMGDDGNDVMDYMTDARDGKKPIIEIEPLQYIRGRNIRNSIMIVDEAQNLSIQDVKTIVTRISDDSKIILLGDLDQIDNYYVSRTSNGLAQTIEKFKDSELVGHIQLIDGVRSALATEAADRL